MFIKTNFFISILLVIVFYQPIAYAGEHDWVIPKLPTKFEDIDQSTYAIGHINKQKYLAILLNLDDESDNSVKPALIVAKVKEDRSYVPLKVIEVTSLMGISVKIKNESVYIRFDNAHHGVYFTTYQFKPEHNQFRLVSLETQSITPSYYAGVDGNIELWEGSLTNLLSAKATFWAQTFDLDKPNQLIGWEKALKRHNQGLTPTNATARKVKLKINEQWYLGKFDLYNFNDDFLCYHFDYSLIFHNTCNIENDADKTKN